MKRGVGREVLNGYIQIDQKMFNYVHGKDCKDAKNLMDPSF